MKINYYRIIDAELNRLREAVRVIEDISRFMNLKNYKSFGKKLTGIRRKCGDIESAIDMEERLKNRDIKTDTGKKNKPIKKNSLKEIFISNFKRAQESSRVLEEIFKLIDLKVSEEFQKIRFNLYELEKNI